MCYTLYKKNTYPPNPETGVMTTKIGIGFSQKSDVYEAALEAATQARTSIMHPAVDLVTVFSTIHYDPRKFLPVIEHTLDNPKIIGSSTAGIILSDRIETRGIALSAISSDEIRFGIGSVNNVNAIDIRHAGITLARQAIHDFGQSRRQLFFFFADGLIPNNSLLLKGLQEVFGTGFPILGAGSSDDFHFRKTYQFFGKTIMSHAATGCLVGGTQIVSLGSKHGWRPLGKPRTIDTVASGHIIKRIDGKRAFNLYEDYFAQEAIKMQSATLGQLAILYPLGIYIEEEAEYILRNVVTVLEDGSLVCQDEVPEGAEVHIMIGNKDSCKQAAIEAAEEVKKNLYGKEPHLILIFESMARLKLLGRAAIQEIQLIKEILGKATPAIGMYAHGEISPFQSLVNIQKTHLQNQSIVIVALA